MTQNQTGSRAQLLDGRQVADRILSNLSDEVSKHVHCGGLAPGLAVILVGDDPASQVYVSHKVRACEKIGIHSMAHHLPSNVSENELLSLIDDLNADDSVHGILVQLPLPSPLDGLRVTRRILPQKDVDGFHPVNMGLLAQRTPQIRPCTPRGVLALLEAYEINPKYQHAVVVGASNIVGRPLMLELLLAGATVTITHRFTADLEAHVRRADILCVAVGKPDLVQPDWIKPGAVVIDIGISRLPNGQIRGDLDFERASTKAGWITPVPGGVGPMTVAMLMQNTVEAAGLLSASAGKTP